MLSSDEGSGIVIGSSVVDELGSVVISSSFSGEGSAAVDLVDEVAAASDQDCTVRLLRAVPVSASWFLRSRSIKARLPSRSSACWLSLQ